jgi:hypothetical protein
LAAVSHYHRAVKVLTIITIASENTRKMHCLMRKERKIDIRSIIKSGVEMSQANLPELTELYIDYRFLLSKGRYPVIHFVSREAKLRVKSH